MSSHASSILKVLQDTAEARRRDLEEFDGVLTETDDDEIDEDSTMFSKFIEDGGSSALMVLTNFTLAEINYLFKVIEPTLEAQWVRNRGRKSAHKPKDMFLFTLTMLKHGGSWDFLATMFRMKGPNFERLVISMVEVISPFLHGEFVAKPEQTFTMTKLRQDGTTFSHHKFALYATDVTFQQTNRPSGNHSEAKPMFSGKHKLYGVKTEVSVLPNGFAINCSNHHVGSVSDIDIFKSNIQFHRSALKKTVSDKKISDTEHLSSTFPDHWCVIMDKGYQGTSEYVRSLIPHKKPRNGILSFDNRMKNKNISSDRIIVENFFGRFTTLWNVMGSKFRWDLRFYDLIFQLCVALTNFNIRSNPLRQSDSGNYHQLRSRLYHIGTSTAEKRKQSQLSYRARRRARLATVVLADGDGSSAEEEN